MLIRWLPGVYRPLVFLALFWVAALCAAEGDDPASEALRQRLEYLQGDLDARIHDVPVAVAAFLQHFYSRRDFAPVWTRPGRVEELLQIIEASSDEGLRPRDYQIELLRSLQASGADTPLERADFDILLSSALVGIGSHLRFGRVDPVKLDPHWNLSRELTSRDPVGVLEAAIDSESLRAFLHEQLPRQALYQRLKGVLAQYRNLRDRGGWQPVPGGPSLRPGMVSPRVPALRARLRAEGYLPRDADVTSQSYAPRVEDAVVEFQRRHGLEPDGIAGRGTLREMNLTVERRIAQIEANLERARWVFSDLQGDFVLINIAGYRSYLVRGGQIAWQTDVMVGTPYRRTPVFKSDMQYLVFNPTWTIPPGILRRDVIPKMQEDPAYLDKKGYALLDRQGRPVDAASVDPTSLEPDSFPFVVRQPAGPNNALGVVKFIFPNKHFVFLHDTNRPDLFSRRERAFSSGCIRVKNPLTLAKLLLNDPKRWNRAAIERTVASGRTRTVYLDEPLPVLVLYWTIVIEPQGPAHFLKDLYGRDERLIAALAAAPVLHRSVLE